jgi:hypothetical protein
MTNSGNERPTLTGARVGRDGQSKWGLNRHNELGKTSSLELGGACEALGYD